MSLNSREKSSSPGVTIAKWISILTAVLALAFCVRLPLPYSDQVLLSILIVAISICLNRFSSSRAVTFTLTFISLFCTFRYGYWRWDTTIRYLNDNRWQVDPWGLFFAFVLLGAEAYAILVLVLGFFQSARPLERQPVPMPEDSDEWPSVDIFIPTYNEPLEVVRPTILAALSIDWPQDRLNVYVLDDGRRPQFEEFAQQCGASYITRYDNAHAKAGNINNAISKTKGEYIAIFDCDHIATRSFLQMTMGWFLKDPKLGLVQTPHHFYSPDPFERNLGVFRTVPNEGALFYGIVQAGSDLWNASFFCGSCAVLRRTALEEIGGIAVETVTEDAHTSLRLQRRGWNTAYISIPQAAGLATGSLAAHIGQRIRWARGMIQILRTDCPLFGRGLKLSQRLCYLNSVIHYLYGVPRLIFLTAPLVYLILGKSNLYGYLWEIVAYALPHLVLATLTNSRIQGKHRYSFWNEVYETVLAPYIALPTTLALINPKWGKFNVTSKSSVVEERYFDFKVARPYLVLIALNFVGLGMAVPKLLNGGDPTGALTINVFWAALNTLILGTTIAVSIEDRQRRSNVRISTNMPVRIILPRGNAYDCRLIDISEGGLALRPQRELQLRPGIRAEALVRSIDGDQKFAVQVIQSGKAAVRLQFTSPDLEQQRALTRVVYSRADSWLNWTEGQNHDQILRSLFGILGIGVKGLLSIPGALFSYARQEANESKLAQVGQAIAPLILFALLVFAALSARGAEAAPGNISPATESAIKPAAAGRSFHDQRDLFSLGQPDGFRLRGVDGQATLSFGVPETKVVSEGSLNLELRAPYNTLAADSTLDVVFNGSNIASLSLRELQPDHSGLLRSQIPLPADLFVTDNSLSFHFHSACIQPCTEQAKTTTWLLVSPTTKLDTTGVLLPLPNQLRILPAPFFDTSLQRIAQLPIAFAAKPDARMLEAAGLVSSWYSILADFRGTHFPVSVGEIPQGNAVLIAPSDSSLISQLGIPVSGPVIALRDNPSDPYSKVLVLSGQNADQILTAARALALGQFPSGVDTAQIWHVEMPAPRVPYDAPNWSQARLPSVKLAAKASEGMLVAGKGNEAKLYFRLAPDLYFGSSTSVPLRLVYHVSGLPAGSRAKIHIKLNGVAVSSREIGINGSGLESQSFAIPTSLLYASDTLLVDFTPITASGTVADQAPAQLIIDRETELEVGSRPHYVRMPRMDLFANSGFPFTRFADLSRTTIVLPRDPSAGEIETYLDSIGFLSAQTGYPSLRATVVDATQLGAYTNKDLLIIGSGHDQPLFAQLASVLPVQIGDGGFSANPNTSRFLGGLRVPSFLRRDDQPDAKELLEGSSRATAVLEQFSAGPNSTALIVAASSPDSGHPIMGMLRSASIQGNVSGNVEAVIDGRFQSFQLESATSYVGSADWWILVEFWLRLHFWLVPVLVLICAYVLGSCWEAYLERVAAQRLEAAS